MKNQNDHRDARNLSSRLQRPLLAGALAATSLAAPPAIGAFDIFLKLQGIDGESIDTKHAKEIDVLSYSFGFVTGPSEPPRPPGKPACVPLVIQKYLDTASPKLMEAAMTGMSIPTGRLTVRKPGGVPIEFYFVDMSNIVVSSVAQSGDELATGIAEKVTLGPGAYTITYRPQDQKGGLGPAVVFSTNCTSVAAPAPPPEQRSGTSGGR
jgi:type VI secretion system secreted protein Hcp